MEITASITTKFDTVIKNTKYSLWIIQIRPQTNPRRQRAAILKFGKLMQISLLDSTSHKNLKFKNQDSTQSPLGLAPISI